MSGNVLLATEVESAPIVKARELSCPFAGIATALKGWSTMNEHWQFAKNCLSH